MMLFLDFIDFANGKQSKFFIGNFPKEIGLKKLYYILLDIFDRQILILNQTMFVQFIIFYFCQCKIKNFT